jgi:hypothetical protein
MIEPPLNGLTNCAFIYGFHIYDVEDKNSDTKVVFKILDKNILGKKTKRFTGFKCIGASNRPPLLNFINMLYAYQKEHSITELEPILLEVVENDIYLNTSSGPSLIVANICLYVEILLRAFQSVEKTKLRWVLSLIDTVLAENESKKIFQFKWMS